MAWCSSYHYHPPESSKFKENKKMRNDSGCDVSSDDGAVGPSWVEMVADWSFKSHSIISQEVVRMQEATARRKRDMEAAADDAERDAVAERWREEGK